MFYFLTNPYLIANGILIASAALPALLLMYLVYRADRLEKESPQLIKALARAGVLSSLLALVEERVLSLLLDSVLPEGSILYSFLLYFVIVACAEESSKYLFMKRETWNNPEFNCLFDGVVYGVFVSLGFAIWENISYVMTYGLSVAIIRAITAIPGHACFGVFMGVFYGFARKFQNQGADAETRKYKILAFAVPALLHGAYDFIASIGELVGGWFFLAFVGVMFGLSVFLVRKVAGRDQYID